MLRSSGSSFNAAALAITGGTINGAVIGGTTPAAATFTTETLTAAAPVVLAGQVGLGATTATIVGVAGAASALPAAPTGYLLINVAGTVQRIPYYN